jgi:hypothetical protein
MLFMEDAMCNHPAYQTIEEGMVEERWEEGDLFIQETFDWIYCPDCGENFSCKSQ